MIFCTCVKQAVVFRFLYLFALSSLINGGFIESQSLGKLTDSEDDFAIQFNVFPLGAWFDQFFSLKEVPFK